MKCPHCKRDIREAAVLQGAAAIVARRRRRAGNDLTPERAREIQLKSAAAKRLRQARRRAGGNRRENIIFPLTPAAGVL
jgi:hypothetical protein